MSLDAFLVQLTDLVITFEHHWAVHVTVVAEV